MLHSIAVCLATKLHHITNDLDMEGYLTHGLI